MWTDCTRKAKRATPKTKGAAWNNNEMCTTCMVSSRPDKRRRIGRVDTT